MPYVLVCHKIEDYAKCKPVFDEQGPTRGANGSKGGRLFRSAGDPNELVILLEWDEMDKARQFAQSEELREAMERAGVADQPDVYFLNEVEQTSV